MTARKPERWSIFARQSLLDARFWLFTLLMQVVWHLIFLIVIFQDIETLLNFHELMLASFNALRFDGKVAAVFTLMSWLLISVPSALLVRERFSNLIRYVWLWMVWLFSCIANLGQIGYYGEYHNTFDFNLFALVYDDFDAIVATVYHEYNLLLYLFILIISGILGGIILLRYFRKPWNLVRRNTFSFSENRVVRNSQGIVLVVICVFLLLLSSRGSFGNFPLQYKNIGVTRDSLLNEAALNPFNAFIEAYSKHKKIIGQQGISRFSKKPIEEILTDLFPSKYGRNLDDFTATRVTGKKQKPRHIFLMVLESYGTWPLLKKYQELELLEGMKLLSDDPKGHLFLNFLPSSTGTMSSFASMITGMQDVSVFTNYQPQSSKIYPTSLPDQIARLGYRTRFFYGGSESWHDVSKFLKNQGVEEVHSWANIAPVNDGQIWGLPDSQLYDYVLRTIDDSKPSLNIIMSISFHPPYTLDLGKFGVDMRPTQRLLNKKYPQSVDANTLGHWKYADQEMYKFIKATEKKLDNSLFILTGDHYANNKHVVDKPPLYETTTVPLLLYGSMLKDMKIDTSAPGSHLDIAPTLIELSAPTGFTYHSLGQNMLDTKREFALSSRAVISRDYVGLISQLPNVSSIAEGKALTLDQPLSSSIVKRFNSISAYSWWRIIKGTEVGPLPIGEEQVPQQSEAQQ